MRGAALPTALMSTAIGLLLSYAQPKDCRIGSITLVASATLTALSPLPAFPDDAVFMGCWISLLATAALVHLERRIIGPPIFVICANAGLWSGLATHVGGGPIKLLMGLPWVLTAIPGRKLAALNKGVALRVVASWLIAIAGLEAALSFIPTPGYRPDHMD